MNGVISAVQGRLPRDAGPLRYSSGGRPFLSFSVAVHDAKTEPGDPTEWARISIFGELAEQLDGVLVAGREVYCEGRLRLTSWCDPEGIDRPTLNVTAWKCEVLGAIGRGAPRRHPEGQPRRRGAMSEALAVTGGARNTRQLLGLDDDGE